MEEKVFENKLDTGLIGSACFISMHNTMKKTKVMEAMEFS